MKRATTQTYVKYGETCSRGHKNPECYVSGQCRECCLLKAKGLLPRELRSSRVTAATYVRHGTTCKRGHVNPECYVSSGGCKQCSLLAASGTERPPILITPREAARLGGSSVYVGSACARGHRLRHVSNKSCVECMRAYQMSDTLRNRKKETDRAWLRRNPWVGNLNTALRRGRMLNATPSWLTEDQLDEMRGLYMKARILTEATSVEHHVDHIVPLRGKNVSGLNVPWNLRILTGADNLAKKNNLPEEGDLLGHTTRSIYCVPVEMGQHG